MAKRKGRPLGLGPKYIEVTIDVEGETKIEAHGFKDGACRQATKALENDLGEVTKRVTTGSDCQEEKQRTG